MPTSFVISGSEMDGFLADGDWKMVVDSRGFCKEILHRETGLCITIKSRPRRRLKKTLLAVCYLLFAPSRDGCPMQINVDVTLNSNGSSAVVNVKTRDTSPHIHYTSCCPTRPSRQSILDKLSSTTFQQLKEANKTSTSNIAAKPASQTHDGLQVSRKRFKSAQKK